MEQTLLHLTAELVGYIQSESQQHLSNSDTIDFRIDIDPNGMPESNDPEIVVFNVFFNSGRRPPYEKRYSDWIEFTTALERGNLIEWMDEIFDTWSRISSRP